MNDFIGVFDSGIGGLTVFDVLKETLKDENIVYLADTLNCPYGIKSKEEIKKITLTNIEYLKKLGAKAVVIACNTATSSIIEEIKASDGYLIGVIEPTAQYALNVSKTKEIGLFATNLTVSSKAYDLYLKDAKLYSEGCSDFVLPIENGDLHSDNMKILIKNHIENLGKIDTLILGCTHFPYIKDEIQKFLPDVTMVDSGFATTEILQSSLEKKDLLTKNKDRKLMFLTTGNLVDAKKQLERLNYRFNEVKNVII